MTDRFVTVGDNLQLPSAVKIQTAAITDATPIGVSLIKAADGPSVRTIIGAASSEPYSIDSYGATPGGIAAAAANTTALNSALNAAAAAHGVVTIPGDYFVNPFVIPPGVIGLLGRGRGLSALRNASTAGGVFISGTGSKVTVSGLLIDGQRAAQTATGLAAIQFAKANSFSAGVNIAGGLTLSAAVTAGAVSIAVTSATNVYPDEAITVNDGTNLEILRVAQNYTNGALTIPLVDPVIHAFATSSWVTVAPTNILIENCEVRSNGRDCIALWHNIDSTIRSNWCSDQTDTAIDLPSAGSQGCIIEGNHIDTTGQWGISLDTAETYFGNTSRCTVRGNTIRFRTGGPTVPTDGIYLGVVDNIIVENNVIDLRRAGLSGVRIIGSGSFATIQGNMIGGAPGNIRAGTTGIRTTPGASGPNNPRPLIAGNIIREMANGIDLDVSLSASVIGNSIFDVSGYAITALASPTGVQKFAVTDNICDTCVVGVRFGSTPVAGSMMAVTGNVILNASYTMYIADSPSNMRLAGNPGLNPRGLQSPAMPASGVTYSPGYADSTVYISGGTVTAIVVNGTTTGLTSGAIRVCIGETIAITYSVAPTWVWFSD